MNKKQQFQAMGRDIGSHQNKFKNIVTKERKGRRREGGINRDTTKASALSHCFVLCACASLSNYVFKIGKRMTIVTQL